MQPKHSWQRALIGVLLILNAIPFSLDPSNRHFAYGVVAIILGLAILGAPIPIDREFSLLDGVRVACSAMSLAVFAVFYNRAPTMISILLVVIGIVPLFIPWRFSKISEVSSRQRPEEKEEAQQ